MKQQAKSYEARKALKKEFERYFKDKEDDFKDEIAFFVDESKLSIYRWKFITPDGYTHTWDYNYTTREINKKKKREVN